MPRHSGRGEITNHANVFDLDLHRALVEQLPEALENLTPASLTRANLGLLGDERGVYQLFQRERSVYVGKSEQPLATRLEQHRRRCSGRRNIDVEDMSFRCLYVSRFVDAASPERILIGRYRGLGEAPWNISEGFAPKDVGRQRDGSKPGQWFLDHPADYEAVITVPDGSHPIPMIDALRFLKEAVPFDLFRYASNRSDSAKDRADANYDYPGRSVVLPTGPTSVLRHVQTIVEALPSGWQATVLPYGVILYKEAISYGYALAGWRRTATSVEKLARGHETPALMA